MSAQPTIVNADGGQHFNVLGSGIEVVLHGRDTGGTLAVCVASGEPGNGPPPHVHSREDETFHVLVGEVEGFVGDQTFQLSAGMTAFLPRGVPHTYRIAGKKSARFLVMLTPAGFEEFFEKVGGMTPAEQQNIPAIIALGNAYGLDFLPPK